MTSTTLTLSIVGLVIGNGLLSFALGHRLGKRRFFEPRDRTTARERVLIRPDRRLYSENERLRDQLAAQEVAIVSLRKEVRSLRDNLHTEGFATDTIASASTNEATRSDAAVTTYGKPPIGRTRFRPRRSKVRS